MEHRPMAIGTYDMTKYQITVHTQNRGTIIDSLYDDYDQAMVEFDVIESTFDDPRTYTVDFNTLLLN